MKSYLYILNVFSLILACNDSMASANNNQILNSKKRVKFHLPKKDRREDKEFFKQCSSANNPKTMMNSSIQTETNLIPSTDTTQVQSQQKQQGNQEGYKGINNIPLIMKKIKKSSQKQTKNQSKNKGHVVRRSERAASTTTKKSEPGKFIVALPKK